MNNRGKKKAGEPKLSPKDLAFLLKSTGSDMLLLDERGRIRWFSPGVGDLLEVSSEDVGRLLGDLTRKFTDPALDQDLGDALARGKTGEAIISADNGRSYLRRTSPFRATGEAIAGVVVNFVDIAADQLAASQFSGIKKQFLSSFSHDVRTPLSGMLLWARMLLDQPDLSPAQIKEGLQAIHHCAEEQRIMIENLVANARRNAGVQPDA